MMKSEMSLLNERSQINITSREAEDTVKQKEADYRFPKINPITYKSWKMTTNKFPIPILLFCYKEPALCHQN